MKKELTIILQVEVEVPEEMDKESVIEELTHRLNNVPAMGQQENPMDAVDVIEVYE